MYPVIRVAENSWCLHGDNEYSEMTKLIRVIAGRKGHIVGFSMHLLTTHTYPTIGSLISVLCKL